MQITERKSQRDRRSNDPNQSKPGNIKASKLQWPSPILDVT